VLLPGGGAVFYFQYRGLLKIKHRKDAHQEVRRFVFPSVAGFPSVREIFRGFPESPQQFCYYFPFHAPFISCFFEIGIADKAPAI
jgi:hypothetical protein